MLLFEKKKYNIDIEDSTDVLRARLKENIHKPVFGEFDNSKENKIQGSLTTDSFKVTRHTNYRTSFIPIMEGRMTNRSNGSNIELIIYARPSTIVFYMGWMTLSIVCFFWLLFSSISNSILLVVTPILIIFILIANISTYSGYNKEFKRSKDLIVSIIKDNDKEK